jgi:hypothetical protein
VDLGRYGLLSLTMKQFRKNLLMADAELPQAFFHVLALAEARRIQDVENEVRHSRERRNDGDDLCTALGVLVNDAGSLTYPFGATDRSPAELHDNETHGNLGTVREVATVVVQHADMKRGKTLGSVTGSRFPRYRGAMSAMTRALSLRNPGQPTAKGGLARKSQAGIGLLLADKLAVDVDVIQHNDAGAGFWAILQNQVNALYLGP